MNLLRQVWILAGLAGASGHPRRFLQLLLSTVVASIAMLLMTFGFAGLNLSLNVTSGMSQLSIPTIDRHGVNPEDMFSSSPSGRTFLIYSSGAERGRPSAIRLSCGAAGKLADTTQSWGNRLLSNKADLENDTGYAPKSDHKGFELFWSKLPQIQVMSINSSSDTAIAFRCSELVDVNGEALPNFIPFDAISAIGLIANFLLLAVSFVVIITTVSLAHPPDKVSANST